MEDILGPNLSLLNQQDHQSPMEMIYRQALQNQAMNQPVNAQISLAQLHGSPPRPPAPDHFNPNLLLLEE
jgi:hypothetical protein